MLARFEISLGLWIVSCHCSLLDTAVSFAGEVFFMLFVLHCFPVLSWGLIFAAKAHLLLNCWFGSQRSTVSGRRNQRPGLSGWILSWISSVFICFSRGRGGIGGLGGGPSRGFGESKTIFAQKCKNKFLLLHYTA